MLDQYQVNDLINIKELTAVSSPGPPPRTPRALFEQFHDPRSSLPLFQPLISPKSSPSKWRVHASALRTPVRDSPKRSPFNDFISPGKKKTPGKSAASPLRLVNTTTPSRLNDASLNEIHKASLSWTSEDARHHSRGMLMKELISLLLVPKTQTRACQVLASILERFPSLLVETNKDSISTNLLIPLAWTDSRPHALNLFRCLAVIASSAVLTSKPLLKTLTLMISDATKPSTNDSHVLEATKAIDIINTLLKVSLNEAAMAILHGSEVAVGPLCKLFNCLKDRDQNDKEALKLILSSFSLMAEASVAACHHICKQKILEGIVQLSLNTPELTSACFLTLANFAGRPDQETRGKVKEACEESHMMNRLAGIVVKSGSCMTDISLTNGSIVLLWTLCNGDDYKKEKIMQLGTEGDIPRALALIMEAILTTAVVPVPGASTRLLENSLGLTSCLLSLLKSEWSKREQTHKTLSLPLNPEDEGGHSIAFSLATSSIRCIELNIGGLSLLTNLCLHQKGVDTAVDAGVFILLQKSELEKLLKSSRQAAAMIANFTRNASEGKLAELDWGESLKLLADALVRLLTSSSPHPSSSSLNDLYALCSAIECTSKLASAPAPPGVVSDAAVSISGHLLLIVGRAGSLEEKAGQAALAALNQLLTRGYVHPEHSGLMENIMNLLPQLLEGTVCKEGGDLSTSLLVLSLLQELARSRRVASSLISNTRVSKLILRAHRLMKDDVEVLLMRLNPFDRFGALKHVKGLSIESEVQDIDTAEQPEVGRAAVPESDSLLPTEEAAEAPADMDEDEDGPQALDEEVIEGDVEF